MQRRLSYTATQADEGMTVLAICRQRLHMTRHAVSRAKFVDCGIMLGRKRARTNKIVHAGQRVSIVIGDSSEAVTGSNVVASEGALDILLEDEDLLVINKPAGLATHPGPGHFSDTLGNRVMAHFTRTGVQASLHPVHRLDIGTSGLVIVAKNAYSQHRLQRTLHTPDFKRVYQALCCGKLPAREGDIAIPIGQLPGERTTRALPLDQGGKEALTHYRVLAGGMLTGDTQADAAVEVSHVELVLGTGRTHQIRIHLSALGCPLLGDDWYGQASPLIARPALHAAQLEFTHPVTGEHLVLESKPPIDFSQLVSQMQP